MSKKPATVSKSQAAVLILCIALAALILAGSACVWIVRSRRQDQPSVSSTPEDYDQTNIYDYVDPDDVQHATVSRPAGTIALGTWIGEVDVSGMTEEEAYAALANYVERLPDAALTVSLPDRVLLFEQIRTASIANPGAYVREALNAEGGAIPLTLDYSIDGSAIRETIRSAAAAIAEDEGTASYCVENGTLYFTPGTVGVSLDTEGLYDAVVSAYSRLEVQDISFDYTEVSTAAEELRLLRDQIYIAPQNARYDPVTTGISEAVSGWDIDMAQAVSLLDTAEPGETVAIPLVEVPAAVDKATLNANLFRESLGNCSSAYYANAARTNNLFLACQAINGTVVQPGECFSFNDVVGERTEAKGYQTGTVYVSGISQKEVGGGVCQVASTIYCAALYANLEIVERTEHMYLVSYVPYGMDATVYWGSVDFVFRNNTDYPIIIYANTNNGYVNVSLMGTEVTGNTVEMDYLILSTTPWEEQIVEDEEKPKGYYEVTDATPYTGYKINTYRTVKDAEGNTLSTTLEATSNYAVANRIIIVGAGTDVEAAADSTDSFVPVEIPEEALTNDGQPVTVTADEIAGDQ